MSRILNRVVNRRLANHGTRIYELERRCAELEASTPEAVIRRQLAALEATQQPANAPEADATSVPAPTPLADVTDALSAWKRLQGCRIVNGAVLTDRPGPCRHTYDAATLYAYLTGATR